MKLLLDENLSRRLVPFLQNDFPDSTQVALLGLERATDREIWEFAKSSQYVIVTLNADFQELSAILGHPPQIIWLKTPNPSRSVVLRLLIDNAAHIKRVLLEEHLACIELRKQA